VADAGASPYPCVEGRPELQQKPHQRQPRLPFLAVEPSGRGVVHAVIVPKTRFSREVIVPRNDLTPEVIVVYVHFNVQVTGWW
jgi:hypothetical protein